MPIQSQQYHHHPKRKTHIRNEEAGENDGLRTKQTTMHQLLRQLQTGSTKVVETPKGRRLVFRPLQSSDVFAPDDGPSPSFHAASPVGGGYKHYQRHQQQPQSKTIIHHEVPGHNQQQHHAAASGPDAVAQAHLPRALREVLFGSGPEEEAAPSPLLKLLESAKLPSKKTDATALKEMLGIPPAASSATMTATTAGVKTASPTHERPPSGSGVQWLFDAVERATSAVMQQGNASWGPASTYGSNSAAAAAAALTSPWDFGLPEDMIDDEVLFRREELRRRRNPRYLARTRRLHDLHIVLPLCVPNGTIVVEDPMGANYYRFDAETHKHQVGAHILFGKGVPPGSPPDGAGAIEADATAITDLEHMKPVCDVWASFLHVRLGTIYNLAEDQVVEVVNRFKSAFDRDLCYFYVPITMDCRGLYPSTDDMISQRAGKAARRAFRDTNTADNTKGGGAERYETRGTPATENDIKRLRMLRRYLKRFAMGLATDLGFNYPHGGDAVMPTPCVELHDNCRTSTLQKGSLRIIVREWSSLNDPEIFKKVWHGRLASSEIHHGVADDVWAKLLEDKDIPSARTVLGEIRLEYNHLRMVDPRWPDELVLGRRIADYCPHVEIPGPATTAARFVFCSRVRKPPVQYAYAHETGEDPRAMALNSRLASLYKVHLQQHPNAGSMAIKAASPPLPKVVDGQTETTTTTTTTDGAPAPGDLSAPQQDGAPPPGAVVDGTDLPAPLQKLVASSTERHPQPTTSAAAPCKFFLRGGCARADRCFFLHPADPSLESQVDVRSIMPKHPQFF